MNQMKNTRCLKCDKDLNNVTYEKMMDHIAIHQREEESNNKQKGLGDFPMTSERECSVQ
jgi:hypothetical protein